MNPFTKFEEVPNNYKFSFEIKGAMFTKIKDGFTCKQGHVYTCPPKQLVRNVQNSEGI